MLILIIPEREEEINLRSVISLQEILFGTIIGTILGVCSCYNGWGFLLTGLIMVGIPALLVLEALPIQEWLEAAWAYLPETDKPAKESFIMEKRMSGFVIMTTAILVCSGIQFCTIMQMPSEHGILLPHTPRHV